MHYFLGPEVWQSLEYIFLNYGKYVVEILNNFDMLECKFMATVIPCFTQYVNITILAKELWKT